MRKAILGLVLACFTAFPQAPDDVSKFEAADVHGSAKSTNQYMRTGPVRGGRYEVKTAAMVGLIHLAYGYDNDKILGGPNWLEMDPFDVIAKVPPRSNPETEADDAGAAGRAIQAGGPQRG